MSNRLFLTVMVIGIIIITACVSAAATVMLTKQPVAIDNITANRLSLATAGLERAHKRLDELERNEAKLVRQNRSVKATLKSYTAEYAHYVGEPKGFAHVELEDRWAHSQYPCLVQLWHEESRWRVNADNPSSSAYGIPQALPGSKMGPGWQSDHEVQISWGLRYIGGRYSSPCSALSAKHGKGWY